MMQVELEGHPVPGMPRKLLVGPDVSKCLLDGEGLSSAKAGSPKPSPPVCKRSSVLLRLGFAHRAGLSENARCLGIAPLCRRERRPCSAFKPASAMECTCMLAGQCSLVLPLSDSLRLCHAALHGSSGPADSRGAVREVLLFAIAVCLQDLLCSRT